MAHQDVSDGVGEPEDILIVTAIARPDRRREGQLGLQTLDGGGNRFRRLRFRIRRFGSCFGFGGWWRCVTLHPVGELLEAASPPFKKEKSDIWRDFDPLFLSDGLRVVLQQRFDWRKCENLFDFWKHGSEVPVLEREVHGRQAELMIEFARRDFTAASTLLLLLFETIVPMGF